MAPGLSDTKQPHGVPRLSFVFVHLAKPEQTAQAVAIASAAAGNIERHSVNIVDNADSLTARTFQLAVW